MTSLDPVVGLTEFFTRIWGQHEGFVYLPIKDTAGNWSKTWARWPNNSKGISNAKQVIDTVLANSAMGKEVYFSPVIWAKPKYEREAILGSQVLWADF